jgi:hypothetical protein
VGGGNWVASYHPGYGAVAQLGEHLVCNQGVEGSNPFSSTLDTAAANTAGKFFENISESVCQ